MTDICSNIEVLAYLGISVPTAAETAMVNLLRPKAESAVRRYVGFTITQATHTHFLPVQNENAGEIEGLDVVNGRVAFEFSNATDKMYLPERPVRSITSLYEDSAAYGGQGSGDFPAGSALTGGTDYYIDYTTSGVSWSGLLRKVAGTWSVRARTIKAVYVAGLTAAELAGTSIRGPNGGDVLDLKFAAIIAAALAIKEASGVQGSNAGPITSERLSDYSVSYGKSVDSLFGFNRDLPPKVKELLDPYRRYSV